MSILEVKNVNKRFGGLQALGDVNLSVEDQTVHAIIGPNGAGKSTLLNCLVGKLIPDTGSVMFDGQSVLGRKPFEINQMGISRVFQTPEIFGDLSVLENMMIPIFAKRDGAFRMHAVEQCMNEKEIVEQAEHMLESLNMADDRHMHSAAMSRGNKRRLEIGMCLAQNPRLLLLDEPTAGMARADTNNTIDLLKQIKDERDITIAIIEHDMHVVFSLAERITVLAQGTPLVEDTPDNIKGHPKVREAYLGERPRLRKETENERQTGLLQRQELCRNRPRLPVDLGTCNPIMAKAISCRASALTCTRARSSRCWAATARARRRRCARLRGWTARR